MKNIKYFCQFLIIFLLFLIFRLFGYKIASNLGYIIGKNIGPKFRPKKLIINNIKNFKPSIKDGEVETVDLKDLKRGERFKNILKSKKKKK